MYVDKEDRGIVQNVQPKVSGPGYGTLSEYLSPKLLPTDAHMEEIIANINP
jgi:hypothetical protein